MKKILLLGGSAQQVVAIETAKRMGIYTILCDYLTDNPGQYFADKFYLISSTDKEAVLKVARDENIDGILAYASDPAAPTAAYVAEKMGLPGIPYESVDILCNKDKFRIFLEEHGFHSPKSKGFSVNEEVGMDCGFFSFPVMAKPVDSSGSKGATVVRSHKDLKAAAQKAGSYSRSNRFIVEEYIEKKHPYLIGGDIFVYGGEVIQWGLMNCHRDTRVNPLVPAGKSYPVLLAEDDIKRTKEVLQQLIDCLQIQAGALNVELIIDQNNNVWPIDIGPRSGGNMIPDLLSYIYGTDVVEMCVRVAMGISLEQTEMSPVPYYATYNLHTDQNGIFKGVHYSDKLKRYIIRDCIYKKPGDPVEYFNDASSAIGIVFFKFNTQKEMMDILEAIDSFIEVDVEISE